MTDFPACASVIAAASPFGPEPITTASYCGDCVTDQSCARERSYIPRQVMQSLAVDAAVCAQSRLPSNDRLPLKKCGNFRRID
jgi:hypothetical protein